jgi:cytoskeletal protein CcmA (bactofilin family)
MFDKNQVAVSGPGTIVGSNVKLTGTLKDANDITIFGQIDGEVISENNVMIEENATVKGPITAKTITISGTVNGSITAEVKLEITPSGKVNGSITSRDLIIKSGAQFDGKSAMIKEKYDEKSKIVLEKENEKSLENTEKEVEKVEDKKFQAEE